MAIFVAHNVNISSVNFMPGATKFCWLEARLDSCIWRRFFIASCYLGAHPWIIRGCAFMVPDVYLDHTIVDAQATPETLTSIKNAIIGKISVKGEIASDGTVAL